MNHPVLLSSISCLFCDPPLDRIPLIDRILVNQDQNRSTKVVKGVLDFNCVATPPPSLYSVWSYTSCRLGHVFVASLIAKIAPNIEVEGDVPLPCRNS